MTTPMTVVPDADAETRWRAWQARGVESDRRTAKRMRGLMLLIAAGLVGWLLFQFM